MVRTLENKAAQSAWRCLYTGTFGNKTAHSSWRYLCGMYLRNKATPLVLDGFVWYLGKQISTIIAWRHLRGTLKNKATNSVSSDIWLVPLTYFGKYNTTTYFTLFLLPIFVSYLGKLQPTDLGKNMIWSQKIYHCIRNFYVFIFIYLFRKANIVYVLFSSHLPPCKHYVLYSKECKCWVHPVPKCAYLLECRIFMQHTSCDTVIPAFPRG